MKECPKIFQIEISHKKSIGDKNSFQKIVKNINNFQKNLKILEIWTFFFIKDIYIYIYLI